MEQISTFGLELYSSTQMFYKGRARFINLPATDGGHTFLPHHENVIVALVPGTTTIITENGEEITAVTGSGFAEMINNRVQVFVHSAEYPDEIDINRAREAKERAEEQLRQKQSIAEYHRSKMELARAMSRISEAGKRK
ncbi:ATP synthase F1 subunit epsilon [[Clostridium] symbiosum]|uniref:ATP synthase F1 subunit epsilon n=1 Tax=Clostridium symbiosum TaxID=1512 RepID=UPI001D06F3BE|nr:ATP synthase F1 subunit epsilon [[Clostridium] symbiosum]MCB6608244.1 ATP synthase F1 subunit epsilon [[Clostridium] symbiosum]MCB6930802.1 ATP synthase F1 subunit epsilon [[Clostridium] symbiosum]